MTEQTQTPFVSEGPKARITEWERKKIQIREWVINELKSAKQPGACELLTMMEFKFGWTVRAYFSLVMKELREDKDLQGYKKDYLRTVLSDESIDEALRGTAKPTKEFKSTLDDLFHKSVNYRLSTQFQEAIDFVARFRDYAPYNNMLVKIQRPSCGFYATANDWQARFNRAVKEDALPLLILAPMHPVMLVFDLDDTEGEDLPEQYRNFAKAEGEWNPKLLEKTLDNTKRDLIQVQFKTLGFLHGGFATTRLRDNNYKMRVAVHDGLDEKSRYSVLCHELAHIYLGHLGTDVDNWWPCRINLSHATVEIEAEAVSHIVCTRAGLVTFSAPWNSGRARYASIFSRIGWLRFST